MKLILATLISLATLTAQAAPRDTRPADGACEWRNPGSDKYMLPLDAAVDRLTIIPAATREKLKARLRDPRKHLAADDHIVVTAAGAQGVAGQYSLWDMNGGAGQVCWGAVTTRTWQPTHAERAMVFCEDGHCLAYYSVCRNISRAVLTTPEPEPPQRRAEIPAASWVAEDVAEPWDVALDPPTFAVASAPTPEAARNARGRPADTWWQPLPQPFLQTEWRPVGDVPVVQPVPEPTTWASLALGLACLAIARHYGRRS